MDSQRTSNIIFSSPLINLQKRKDIANTLVVLSMLMVFFPIDTYKRDVDEISSQEYERDWESLRASISEFGFGTARCPHKCLQRAVPLCQTQLMESNHLADTCPLRNPRKDLLSRLFRSITH